MYIAASKLAEELSRRRKDTKLRKAVGDYLAIGLPEGWPIDKPIATINRYIASGRVEDLVFAHSATSLGLRPYWPTYHAERFSVTNPEKVGYLRPRVQLPKLQVTNRWLVLDHRRLEGMPIGHIIVGEDNLQALHVQVREKLFPAEILGNTFDVSSWNQAQALRFGAVPTSERLAPYYYHAVMALYICHGVLFEDFDGGPNAGSGLGRFVQEVVEPAIKSVKEHFGLAPLIVQLPYTPGFSDYPSACAAVFDRHYPLL